MPKPVNPKIIHRIFFDDFPPYEDKFLRFEETWRTQMPGYRIIKYNSSNVDVLANGWMRRAHAAKSPVFMSEFIRWDALKKVGGLYLDADCEVTNGRMLHSLIEELYASKEYDAFIGVEEAENGHPTAQTVAAKPGSELVSFMYEMYERHLSAPLWHWREERGLIGPQLMSLYFREKGFNINKGFFCHLDAPMIFGRVKIYTQDYFSPKFRIEGRILRESENTCVYHLFSNLNVEFSDRDRREMRVNPLLYHELKELLRSKELRFAPSARPLALITKYGREALRRLWS